MFDLFKEVLDQVARFVQVGVVRALLPSVRFRRDNRHNVGCIKAVKHSGVGVISFVRQQRFGFDIAQENIRTVQIAGLSGCQMEAGRVAQSVANCVNFGAQPAL